MQLPVNLPFTSLLHITFTCQNSSTSLILISLRYLISRIQVTSFLHSTYTSHSSAPYHLYKSQFFSISPMQVIILLHIIYTGHISSPYHILRICICDIKNWQKCEFSHFCQLSQMRILAFVTVTKMRKFAFVTFAFLSFAFLPGNRLFYC